MQVAGEVCANFVRPSRRPPFIRALAQVSLCYELIITGDLLTVIKSVFFNKQRVLEIYPLGWLVDRFFLETIGIEYNTLSTAAERAAVLPLISIERRLSRVRGIVLFLPYVRHNPTFRCCSAIFNPPGTIHPVAAGSLRGPC